MSVNNIVETPDLARYLEVARGRCDALIDVVDEPLPVNGHNATARFKYVKFDANGQPKFKDLAECLVDHITQYCFSAQRRRRAHSEADKNRLYRQARDLARQSARAGESGELLLYFLMEAVLQAPQMVAKMDLKTARGMEIHGSDGVHMRWDERDSCLDVYFGEAKLYAQVYGALDGVFSSINSFHDQHEGEREIQIVTSHYKWADDRTKEVVLRMIDRQDPAPDCRWNHACLIGYDWDAYSELDGSERGEFVKGFCERYRSDHNRLLDLLSTRLGGFRFSEFHMEVFFLPFKSVQEFRDAFNIAL